MTVDEDALEEMRAASVVLLPCGKWISTSTRTPQPLSSHTHTMQKTVSFLLAFLISAMLGLQSVLILSGLVFLAFKGFRAFTSDIGSLTTYPETSGIYAQILWGAITRKKWIGEDWPTISAEQVRCFSSPENRSFKQQPAPSFSLDI